LNPLHRFSKITQISNLIKTRPVGAELFHVESQLEGQTDMMKLRIASHNFMNISGVAHFVPRKGSSFILYYF
jgi:hypothetical protein